MRKTDIFIYTVIIILGFTIYGNSLGNKFIMDDNVLIRDNQYIKDPSNILKIFKKNIMLGVGEEYKFYRPFQIFTYIIDYSLWKLDTRGYHLTNILLHIFSALALYSLVNTVYPDRLFSFLTSILFLAHPIHTEAVAYISGRSDPLSTFFLLLCFTLYVKRERSNAVSMYVLILITYTIAILSRENSIVLPILLLLYHYAFKRRIRIIDLASILILSCVYILIRLTVLKQFDPHLVSTTTILQRLPGFFVAVYNYIKITLFPFGLHMEYGNKLFKFTDPKAIAGLVFMSSLLLFPIIAKKRLLFFQIYWFFIALLSVSNIYPLNAYMAEHWLYLPSIGFFLGLSTGICYLYRVKKNKSSAVILTVILISFYSFLTIRQNNYWKDPITFFMQTLKYVPDSAMPYNNIGIIYNETGRKEDAISFLKKSIEIDLNNPKAYNNLGNVYSSLGNNEEAIALYSKAVEIDPRYVKGYFNLGNAYKSMGEKEKAIMYYEKAIEIEPYFIDAYNNLGIVYRTIGNYEKAIAVYEKGLEINPNHASIHNNLAAAYYYNKQYALARRHSSRAVELGYKVHPELLKALDIQ